jgi:hypothetical protein
METYALLMKNPLKIIRGIKSGALIARAASAEGASTLKIQKS